MARKHGVVDSLIQGFYRMELTSEAFPVTYSSSLHLPSSAHLAKIDPVESSRNSSGWHYISREL